MTKTWEEICKAPLSDITPEETEALPRLCMKRNRYGTTYVGINTERMIVGRDIVSFHMDIHVKRSPGVCFHPEVMVDCHECRKTRFYLRQQWMADGLDEDGVAERLQEWRDDGDLFWCNGCQGTGWRIEPLEDCRRRHNVVTWEDKAMALTGAALAALLRLPTFKMPIPEAVLRHEAARRLVALS